MSDFDRKTAIALELHKIGVSNDGIVQLLSFHALDEIEAQLKYLPFRKAKRPEAFIIEAVRNNYSPPKEFFYAEISAHLAKADDSLDQDAEHSARPIAPDTQGYGAESAACASSPNDGLGQRGASHHGELPNLDASNWKKE